MRSGERRIYFLCRIFEAIHLNPMQTLIDPDHFSLPSGLAYLDSAAEGIPPLAVQAALAAYLRAKCMGTGGRVLLFQEQKLLESLIASLLDTEAENIVTLANTSVALNLLAQNINWQPGDEVLICDLEFPSNVLPWLQLKSRGVRLVVVPSVSGVVELEDWLACISPRTRIISVSQVSYKSGTQFSYLEQLAGHAHAAGAIFCVDATQALGRVPVSVRGVDFLVASSYKWTLGIHGLGIVYVAPTLRDLLRSGTAGWYSVTEVFHPDRFGSFTSKPSAGQLQAGMPNFPAIFALRAGIDYLVAIGIERIDQTLSPLVSRLRVGLSDCGMHLLTPLDPRFASGIVSFAHDQPELLAAKLAAQGVMVWGGDGRIRISVHLYNHLDDIERCLDGIRALTTS